MRLFLKFFVSLHTKRPDRLQWLKTMNKLKTIASYYRVRTFTFTIVSFVIFAFLGCHHGTNNQPEGFKTFWGDSATVFIAKNPQNGYRISIIKNKDLTLANFERGDSLGNPSSVKVVREEYHQFNSDIETIETSELKDNVMQVTSKTKRKY